MSLQITRKPLNYLRLLFSLKKNGIMIPNIFYYATTIEPLDAFTQDLLQRHKSKIKKNLFDMNNLNMRRFMESESQGYDANKLSDEELNKVLIELHQKNKDKLVERIVLGCVSIRKFIEENTLKRLFRHYSNLGKPDMIFVLQKYCAKVDPNLYKRNGEFLHYYAKAQCMKGNSEKGLEILKNSYKRFENLRTFHRLIFRELIQDSVLNRSEASLVIFRKYVFEFSETWDEHYPLLCFWYICWTSTWFSDQMLANDLMDSSEILQEIVKNKATAFSINILKEDYNEDAVTRLLQVLLKYEMMIEYAKVLQVLFNFKLRNRDIRGCAAIIKNCEALGLMLPSDQQGRYIKMLISGKQPDTKPAESKPTSTNFKLKF